MCNSERVTPTFTSSCLDPGFGYENGDGYVRIWEVPRNDGGQLVMRHRWFWQHFVGEIPEGYEINHLCKNRRCCNIEHLECIPSKEHRSKDNALRYLDDYLKFKDWYLNNQDRGLMSQRTMGRIFKRTQSCISNWIKRINEEKK